LLSLGVKGIEVNALVLEGASNFGNMDWWVITVVCVEWNWKVHNLHYHAPPPIFSAPFLCNHDTLQNSMKHGKNV
jgi:hypothetical protein